MKITIGIKALNEQGHIAAAIESALAAANALGGEVVLADSGSTDSTVEIARRYPIRIVQLTNPQERSCGAGAQLAFQYARGEYFYLLDGDMVLDPGFIPAGIAYLEQNPDTGGVGGLVCERNTAGEEFRIRLATVRRERNWLPGEVDRLDCGGLYRTRAIQDAGYFADRNLHAFEEFDLGARLRSRGWKLARIDHPGVDHFGHTTGAYRLLWRRIKTGYSGAPGEVLRGAIGQPHLPLVLTQLGHVRYGTTVMAWWLLLIASLAFPHRPWVTLALLVLPLLFLSIRRGSFNLGLYSLTAWNVSALGLMSGILRRRTSPALPLTAVDITDGPAIPANLSPSEPPVPVAMTRA